MYACSEAYLEKPSQVLDSHLLWLETVRPAIALESYTGDRRSHVCSVSSGGI